ncbi:alpha/beta fold hydrolase [Sphingomonas sp. GlSt437]|uniref:alpha/beta fold hydrolase n=1 Tax=Sphingomonas sp. GlSt437 TaxID=3389970 RepID=UPI003A876023
MPIAKANGVELYYESHGPNDAPVILLIMGLATQMIAWPDEMITGLVARGFRVIAFDNRDIGLSQRIDTAPAPNPLIVMAAMRLGLKPPVGYGLRDMAADATGLLDALGIDAAHIVGVSMGGMIAQNMAALHPGRVRSLTSIMSSSGAPGLPGPSPELRAKLLRRRPANPPRDRAIAEGAELLKMIAYPDPARPADAYHDLAARSFDRAWHPRGARRQLLAIIADGNRAARLAKIKAPTLVIHGAADPLVPMANSEDIAGRITGARLEIIEAMAHDLPPSQVPRLVELIAKHAAAAR